MIRDDFYGVLADGQERKFGGVPEDQQVVFFGNVDRAVGHADSLPEGARVYRLVPLSPSGHYDWGVCRPGETEPGAAGVYVHEQAARACRGDGKLMRRRRGTDTWTEVTE